jgi:hypothetical protein
MSGFSTSMTKSDYQTILSYYKMPYEDLSNRELKRQAETILATKLCKCIKAVEKKTDTQNAISLCTASVFGRKGLKYYDMSCKGRARLLPSKGHPPRVLSKTRKLTTPKKK